MKSTDNPDRDEPVEWTVEEARALDAFDRAHRGLLSSLQWIEATIAVIRESDPELKSEAGLETLALYRETLGALANATERWIKNG